MIHRFVIFGGDTYYPAGGWMDFINVHWDKTAAIEIAKANLKPSGACDWTHVVDLETVDIVWDNETPNWGLRKA